MENQERETYRYEILCRSDDFSPCWEHCDYAVDVDELRYLLAEYRLAYGSNWEFQIVRLDA